MSFEKLIADRFSVRSFSNAKVEQEKLDKILNAGRLAPTACNNQPQRVKVVTGADLEKVDQFTPCRYGAPVVLMICYDKSVCAGAEPFGLDGTGAVDATIAATQMILAAKDQGLGSLWIMRFDPAKAAQMFNLPDNIKPITLINVGYPADGAQPNERHTMRMTVDQMLID